MKDQREEHLDGHLRNLWRTKFDKTRFDVARDGDHLMAYFRCDLCIFRCMKKRNPDRESAMDNRTLGYIRRANLDAFWSRATGTVGNNRSLAGRVAASLSELDLSSGYEDKGPSPFHDDCGYKVAIAVLLDAQRQGKYGKHKTYDSCRKVRSSLSSWERISGDNLSLVQDNKGTASRFQVGGSSSYWYQRFAQGIQSRMGSDVRPNLGVSTLLWHALLGVCRSKSDQAEGFPESSRWIMAGAYFAFGYVLGLRGPEGFLLEIKKLSENKEHTGGLVWLPLVGILKGDNSPGTHYMRSVPLTDTGVDVALWRDDLLAVHDIAGRKEGPAFCDENGFLMRNNTMNEMLWEAMEEIYETTPELFPKAIDCIERIRQLMNISRTMRRTSATQVTRVGVSESDRDVVSRWSETQQAMQNGKKPHQPLRLYYAEQELLCDNFRRYTQAG